MSRNTRVILGFVAAGVVVSAFSVRYLSGARFTPPPPAAVAPAEPPQPKLLNESLPIRDGDTLDEILASAGIGQDQRLAVIAAFNQAYDVRKVRAGRDLKIARWEDSGKIDNIEYTVDVDHKLVLSLAEETPTALLTEIPGHMEQSAFCAVLQDSPYMTLQRAGQDPQLAVSMAELLAYDIDFYRDPQPGDEFCLLLERKVYDNGQEPTNKRILAASYNNRGNVYEAYHFSPDGGKGGHYTRDGKSLQSSFLRSPLEYDARVSSHFSLNRRHPVLHTNRAHYGTDYAAPTGTKVRAVASGKVTGAGYSGGSGNMVTIQHADGYRTQYLHLSRIHVRVGQHVEQSALIGAVGATGLATGPHLDIRISRNGKYMDWERMRAPRTVALAAAQMGAFHAERDRMAALMQAAIPAMRAALEPIGVAGF